MEPDTYYQVELGIYRAARCPSVFGYIRQCLSDHFFCVSKLKMGHDLMNAIIQLINKPGKRIAGQLTLFPFVQKLSKGRKLGLFLLQQPKSGTNYFAYGRNSPCFQLLANKDLEMGVKSNAGILAHIENLAGAPIFGSHARYNNSVILGLLFS